MEELIQAVLDAPLSPTFELGLGVPAIPTEKFLIDDEGKRHFTMECDVGHFDLTK